MTIAEQLKIAGLEVVSSKHGPDLDRAKFIAQALGMSGNLVDSDDVRVAFLERYGYKLAIGNAMGAIFDSGKWAFCGRHKSTRKEAHGRYICQWRWKSLAVVVPAVNFNLGQTVGIADGERFCLQCSNETEKCTCLK
jgi:hypothetical protein